MTGVSILCAVLVLLVLGYVLRAAQGRWLAPGPFFALYWAVGLALPPILAPEFFQSQGADWYVVVLVAAFGLGSLCAGGLRPPVRDEDAQPRPLNLRVLRWLVAFGTVCGLAAFVIIQVVNGYSVTAILSAQGLLDAAAAFSVARYSGGTTTPTVVPLLLAFTFAASLVAPFAARGLRRRGAIACYIAPVAAATLFALVTTERDQILVSTFLLFAGWITAATYGRGRVPQMHVRSVLATGAAVAAIAGTFVAVSFLRVGSFDPTAQRAIGPKLIGYVVGYMPAFAQWLPHAPTGPDAWGAATFSGVAHAGTGASRAFTDYAPVGGVSGTTNIFTAWRYLVEDFGFAGAPLAAFVIGWLVTAAWKRVARKPTPGPALVMLCFYAWALNSVTQTLFLFTNIVVGVAVGGCALYLHPARPKRDTEPRDVRAVRLASNRRALADQ